MNRQYGIAAFILCIILFLQLPLAHAYGESSPEDTREILQKVYPSLKSITKSNGSPKGRSSWLNNTRHYPSSFRNRKSRYIFSKIGPEL
ncbi:hypothetical protein MT997_27945 [Paenibacillus sp. OVF10]|nr:hypothetical protein MT997_27945 [Paenibacillus sp. OVF10]